MQVAARKGVVQQAGDQEIAVAAQTFDLEGLIGRVRSSSYAPLEGQENYALMMAALEQLFRSNQQDGRVRMEYSTHVYYGRLGASG